MENKTVANFKREEQYKYLRGMCLNASAVMIAKEPVIPADQVFQFAEQLFKEGVKRDYMNYLGDKKSNSSLQNKGTMDNPITEEEGRKLDPDKQELVI